MNIFDWVLAGLAAFFVLRGLMRGAVSQIFGVAGILAGFYLALYKYQPVGERLRYYFHSLSEGTSESIAFVLVFLLTWFCISAVGHWIGMIMRGAGLGFLDRTWGGMIGFFKAVLIGIAAVSMLTLLGAHDSPLLTESMLVPYIKEASGVLLKVAPDKVQAEFSKNKQILERFMSDRVGKPLESKPEKTKPGGEKSEKGKQQPLGKD